MKKIITLIMKLMTILDGEISLLPHFLGILQNQVMWWMKEILIIFFNLKNNYVEMPRTPNAKKQGLHKFE